MSLVRLIAPGEYVFGIGVESTVHEFADAEGAAAGFAYVEDESTSTRLPLPQDVPGTRSFADQSEITRSRSRTDNASFGSTDPDVDTKTINLTFRRDNLVANVILTDNRGQEPEIATVEALGGRLLAKIEQVHATGGPGLSPRVLRLGRDGIALTFDYDSYSRIDGQDVPDWYAVVAKSAAATPIAANPEAATPGAATPIVEADGATPRAGSAAPEPIDRYDMFVRIGDISGGGTVPAHGVILRRYATPEEAAAAMAEQRELYAWPPAADDYYLEREIVADAAPVGEESFSVLGTVDDGLGGASPTGTASSGSGR